MLDEMNKIDWEKYRRLGLNSPDIASFILKLTSEDQLVAQNASNDLEEQMEWAYEKNKSDLLFVVAPLLIKMLPDVPDKAFITDLLIFLLSYSKIQTLSEVRKKEALRLKSVVCEGAEIYKRFSEDEQIREDIAYLLKACSEG